jgi:hypothetical protein
VTRHLALNVSQSNDAESRIIVYVMWLFGIQCEVQSRIIVHVIWLVGIQSQVQSHGSLLMLFDWLAFNQVQSHGSLLMSFDWPTIKSRCRVTDHCSCHLIGWHSKPGAEYNIKNYPWLCTWIWMLANQITLTMISDSAPGFECQPIKWH